MNLGVRAFTGFLDLTDALLQFLKRFANGLNEIVNCHLTFLEVGDGEFTLLQEVLLSLFAKLLAVGLENICGQSLEAFIEFL